MTASNDITGDLIQTKSPRQQYRDNYDSIFRKQPEADLDGTGTTPDKPMVSTEEEHY